MVILRLLSVYQRVSVWVFWVIYLVFIWGFHCKTTRRLEIYAISVDHLILAQLLHTTAYHPT